MQALNIQSCTPSVIFSIEDVRSMPHPLRHHVQEGHKKNERNHPESTVNGGGL